MGEVGVVGQLAEGEERAEKRRRRRRKTRQQRLDFSNTRESSSFDPPVRVASSPRPVWTSSGMFARKKRFKKHQKAMEGLSDEEEGIQDATSDDERHVNAQGAESAEEESVVAPARSLRSSQTALDCDDDDEPVRPSARATRSFQRIVISDDDDDDDEDGDGDGDAEINVAPRTFRSSSLGLDGAGVSDEDMPTTQGRQKRKRKRAPSRDSFISPSPSRALDSDDDVLIVGPPKRKRRRQQQSSDEEEEGGSDTAPKTPRRRLKRPARKMSKQEEEDLRDDLDFLGPSSDVEALKRAPRSTQSRQKEAWNAALERLKQRRSSKPPRIPEEDERDGGEDEEEEKDVEAPAERDGLDGSVSEAEGQPASSKQFFTRDENDDNFIDSGEEFDEQGNEVQVPIEFTFHARAKPKELFKHAVEWFVQKKINPAFDMHEELYELAFRKLDDEVRGLAGSKFTSAAWTQDFTLSLNSRPEIAFEPIARNADEGLDDKCDACNRSGHPATYQVQFQGRPYHPETLDEVGADSSSSDDDDDDDDDEDDDEDGARPSYNHQGLEIPPASKIYRVGKFCMANAETAHALKHWRWQLNQWTITWLTKNGFLSAANVVRRDGLSTRKRRREADRITDRMEKEGVIRELWREFRGSVEEARGSTQGRWGVWE